MIDDSALVREAVSVGLAIAGWTVVQAGSGEQGIPLAEEAKPDAIYNLGAQSFVKTGYGNFGIVIPLLYLLLLLTDHRQSIFDLC